MTRRLPVFTEVSTAPHQIFLKFFLSPPTYLLALGTDNQAFAASPSDPASVSQVDEVKKSEEKKKKGINILKYFMTNVPL